MVQTCIAPNCGIILIITFVWDKYQIRLIVMDLHSKTHAKIGRRGYSIIYVRV